MSQKQAWGEESLMQVSIVEGSSVREKGQVGSGSGSEKGDERKNGARDKKRWRSMMF